MLPSTPPILEPRSWRSLRSLLPLLLLAVPWACRSGDSPATAPLEPSAIEPASLVRTGVQIVADADRLGTDLRFLAADERAGRAPCSLGAADVRRFLEERLAVLGLKPLGLKPVAGFEQPFPLARQGDCKTGRNVLAAFPVSAEQAAGRSIVLSAHYDHLGILNGQVMNGADDNASGVAALLEIAHLATASPLRHPLVLAFFDAEETGLQGSRFFVDHPPMPLDSVALNINLDMVSRHEGGGLWVCGTYHYPSLRPSIEQQQPGLPLAVRFGHDRPEDGGEDWTLQSDHGPFHLKKVPFLYLGVDEHPDYHRDTDDADRIDSRFFAASVTTIWRILQTVDRTID